MLFDLVFEGGGVRGVAFIGALEALAENGHEFDRLMGASVGGLTAALLATGHDAGSIRQRLFDPQSQRLTIAEVITPYPDFTSDQVRDSATRRMLRDLDFSFMPNLVEESADDLLAAALMNHDRLHDLFAVIEHMALRQDERWMAWIEAQLNRHADHEDWASMGLAEFYQRSGRSLTVIASDITSASMLVLNHSTAPLLPLKWAVRMTTSVPYLFPPVSWQPEWGLYRQRRQEGHLIVDGALLSQFPLEYFLSSQEEIVAIMGKRKAGNNVLGLLLDETRPVPGLTTQGTAVQPIWDRAPGLQLSSLLLKTLLRSSNTGAANPLESHILRLPVGGVEPYAFQAKQDQLIPAINAAYNATQNFLHGWEKDPRALLSPFERQVAQVVTQQFINGDYYSFGDISHSEGLVFGDDAHVEINKDASGV